MLDKSSLELQLRQVEDAFSKSRINIYSDNRKEKHYSELFEIFDAINKSDLETFDETYILNHYYILEYILNGLEYLDSSTLNIIPYELISCLEYVLDEWIEDNNFIIVTSLSNRHLEYAFSTKYNSEVFGQINQFLVNEYNLKISCRLIRIILPKSLSRDYLSSVVLYHELGHFVDSELSISNKIIFKKYQASNYPPEVESELSHLMEYFADIFAAQYVNQSSNYFLKRITTLDSDSNSHPSTSKRIEVVDKFIKGDNSEIVDTFNEVLKTSNNIEFKIRNTYLNMSTSDFKNLVPQDIHNISELHGIFNLAWDYWLKPNNVFFESFSLKKRYHIINNLVEKSISNFTVTQKWQKK